jgi:flagellar M-ring protein FliF
VPSNNLTELRVALREQNLPGSYGRVPGFELLDTQDMFANRQMQDINYLRAVQGELTRQLTEFNFVNRAFVHIQPAKEQLFVSNQQDSEASVLLDVNRSLNDREIKAVLGMVSTFGGARLDPGNISLTTTDGDILNSPADDEFASVASNQLEHLASHESYLKEKVEAALESIGRRGVVNVGVDLDWSTERVMAEEVTEGAIVSEMVIENTATTSEGAPEGAPGAGANIPQGLAAGETAATEDVESQTLTNYEPARTMTETQESPGRVRQYTIAAFVDSGNRRPAVNADGEPTGEDEYVPMTDEELEQVRSFVAAAVPGVSDDAVTVFDQPISMESLAVAQQAFEEVERARTWAMVIEALQALAPILLLVVGLFIVRRFLLRITAEAPEVEEVLPISQLSPAEMRRQEVANQVERMTREAPDSAASVLRTWMSEEE